MGWSVMSEYPNQKLLDTFTAAFNALRTKDARRFVYGEIGPCSGCMYYLLSALPADLRHHSSSTGISSY